MLPWGWEREALIINCCQLAPHHSSLLPNGSLRRGKNSGLFSSPLRGSWCPPLLRSLKPPSRGSQSVRCSLRMLTEDVQQKSDLKKSDVSLLPSFRLSLQGGPSEFWQIRQSETWFSQLWSVPGRTFSPRFLPASKSLLDSRLQRLRRHPFPLRHPVLPRTLVVALTPQRRIHMKHSVVCCEWLVWRTMHGENQKKNLK